MKEQEAPVTPMSLINNILQIMNLCGYNPRNRTKFRLILGFFVWIVTFIIFVFNVIFIFTNTYNDVGYAMYDIIILAGVWQLLIKLWTLLSKHRSFLKLINLTEYKFWSLDILPQPERSDIQRLYNITKLAVNGYMINTGITLFGIHVAAYFRGKENLVINIWLPDTLKDFNRTSMGHHIIFSILGIDLIIGILCGINTIDSIYIILIVFVIGQLRMMKYELMLLNEKKSVEENKKVIIDCIVHHNLLFDYFHTIEDIFSTELLHVAGTNIIVAVLAVYCGMIENDRVRIIIYIFIFIIASTQLFFFCLTGQLIQDETASVADAAYFTKWEDITDKSIRLRLLLMILRSRKCVNITMGGVFILRLETFTRISRMMLSFLTFMMNIEVGN